MKKRVTLIVILLVILAMYILVRLDAMELKATKEIELTFSSENQLSGSLFLPDKPGPYDVVVFVHGDGAANRTLDGGYNFIMNRLLEAGYACFSYDKAGVGKSSGDWLNQTMKDRAVEVVDAVSAIKKQVPVHSLGTLAFSQGGWVTSELAMMDAPLDFYIVVGGAIDWIEQHRYFETKYAETSGFSAEETNNYLSYIDTSDQLIAENDYEVYSAYVKQHDYEQPMSKERFNFAFLNFEANSIEGMSYIKAPFLGVFGDSDLNVDVEDSIQTYTSEFEKINKTNYELHLIKDASHELLNARYNYKRDQLPYHAFFLGDKIYAQGAIELIVKWLDTTIKNAH